MNNMDSITPQEFAKQMGAYPNAPYNPIPVGGYMDEGFDWVLGAETFEAETLHEKGDYRIIAVEDYDVSMGGAFQERDDFDDLMELSDTHGMFTLSLQKKVMGGWETIDSVSGVVPHYGDMGDIALKELNIPESVDFDAETFDEEKYYRDERGNLRAYDPKIWDSKEGQLMAIPAYEILQFMVLYVDWNGRLEIWNTYDTFEEALVEAKEAAKKDGKHSQIRLTYYDKPIKQAESEQGTMIQVRIGSPSGSTKGWTRIFTVNAPYSNEELAEYVMPSMKIDLHTDAKEYFWREEGDSTPTIVNITMGSPSGQTTGGWQIDEDLMAYGDEEDIETFTLNLMSMIKNFLAVRYNNKDSIQQVLFSINHEEMNRQADLAESKFGAETFEDQKGNPNYFPKSVAVNDSFYGKPNIVGKRKMCADCKDAEGFEANTLDPRNYLSKRKPYGYMMGGLSPTPSGKYRDLEPSRTKLYTFTYSAMKDGIDHLDEEGNQISVFAHTPKEALNMAIQDLRLRENKSIYEYHINPAYSLDNDYNRENRLVSFEAEGHGCGCGGKSAESYSQVMGPTIEANEGGLHSPSSFNITWEDGTGQSSASMPPNEIHFGADSYEESLRNRDGVNRVYCLVCNKLYKSKDGSPIGFTMRNCCGQETETDPNKIDFFVNYYENKGKKNAESYEESGYDFQKMTPSAYTPFDQIGNELQQQRMESGPMLEPTNANYSAEAMPISDDGELLAVYDDMGTNKGFIEMEDDLEDDSIEIEISDDEMNEIAEVRLDSEVVGNPSPSSPLEEVPAKVPSPAEPSNQNFSAEKKTDYVTMILGTAALVVGSGMLAKSQGWIGKEAKAADTDDLPSIDPTVNDGLVASPSTGDLLPADYEEMVVESTGYAVPIIPVSLDGSFMGSRFQALPTDRLVESNEPGIGAHTDVAMYRDTMYREPEQSMVQAPSLNAEHEYSIIDKIMAFFKGKKSEEKEVKESQGVGQAPYFGYGFERKNPQLRVVKETGPIGLDPSTAPYLPQNLSGYTGQAYRPPTIYGDMMGLGVAGASVPFVNPNTATVGANRFGSNPVDSSTLQSIHGNLSSSTNASYTNGSKTMSLAQWSIDYDVSQISDSEAVAVSRSSGIRTMIRRV